MRSGALAIVLYPFQLFDMARKRFAIITYDPDKVEKLWQGEGNSLAWIIWRGLCGWTYPKESQPNVLKLATCFNIFVRSHKRPSQKG